MPLDHRRIARLRAREGARFEEARPRSRALLERARASLPGGVPMSWMNMLYEHPPIFIERGEGAYFTDVDGHRYLDMNQVDLSMNCGYAPAPIVDAVTAQMAKGSNFLLPTEDAIAVAEALAARFGLPKWQFTLSASSANAEAIRIARFVTGRRDILMFEGKYHGHFDDVLVTLKEGAVAPEGRGLLESAGKHLVPYNDLDAAKAALRDHDIACVLVEPALTNVGVVRPEPGFLEGLSRASAAKGCLLIVDEAHTQTCAYGGLTRAWGIDCDIVTLGKCLAGGLPIGAYGMSAALGDALEANLTSLPALNWQDRIATGGTFFAYALSLAAARAALDQILTEAGYTHTMGLGARLAVGIEAAIERSGLPWSAQRLYCRSGVSFAPRLPANAHEAAECAAPELSAALRLYMANRGVFEAIASAGPSASFPMVEADIELYLEVFGAFLTELTA